MTFFFGNNLTVFLNNLSRLISELVLQDFIAFKTQFAHANAIHIFLALLNHSFVNLLT